jgi:hypothetical protein
MPGENYLVVSGFWDAAPLVRHSGKAEAESRLLAASANSAWSVLCLSIQCLAQLSMLVKRILASDSRRSDVKAPWEAACQWRGQHQIAAREYDVSKNLSVAAARAERHLQLSL